MAAGSYEVVTHPILATGALTYGRAVTAAGATAGAAARNLGPAQFNAAIGEMGSVALLGTSQCEAGAAIALGAKLEVDSLGRYVTFSAGAFCGVALQAAAAAGVVFEALIVPN